MADLYHNFSQALLAEYLSVRGYCSRSVHVTATLHSLQVSEVRQGMSPYRMEAYVYLVVF